MNPTPTVSVLMPMYNAAAFLDEAITSVLNQTYADFEFIIVDNCSTDNSYEIIAKYLSDQRVRYFKNETNLGITGNFNRCLEYAQGKYLKFLCSDDKFHPEMLKKFVVAMDENPSVYLVASYSQEFGIHDRVLAPPFPYLTKGKEVIEKILTHWNYLGHPTNVMIRKEGLKVGNFKREYTWLNDWELWLRILAVGDCYIVPEILTYTRFHQGQETSANTKNFVHYFEWYSLVKNIKTKNELNLDFSRLDINGLVKQKAIECTLAIPWAITRGLQKKKNRQLVKKAFVIATEENVIGGSVKLLGQRLINRVFPRKSYIEKNFLLDLKP